MKSNKRDFWLTVIVLAVFAVLVVLVQTGVVTLVDSYQIHVLNLCAIYTILGLSMNLVNGFTGLFSLGQAGFMAIGAYVTALLIMEPDVKERVFYVEPIEPWLGSLQCPFWLALLAGGLLAAVVAFFIGFPVLRLRGDYLAIVTLAFGEIIRNVINCLYISLDGQRLHIAFNNPNVAGKLLVNGPAGATGVNKMATFGMGFALTLFTLFVVLNLIDSRSGRAIMAIRDNRIAAEAMGLNVTKYKMMAFVTSAVLAGMAGALYGLNFSTVAASKFKFDTSILVLVFVVLGGIGNIRGSIISATLLTILPELLRAFANYRMLIYAIVLILVMLATNNPTLRGMVERIIPRGKGRKKEADEA